MKNLFSYDPDHRADIENRQRFSIPAFVPASLILAPGNLLAIIHHYFPQISQRIMVDVNWFVENHEETYYDEKEGYTKPGYYYGQSKDNKSVLERFKRFLNNKRHNGPDWIKAIYQHIPVDDILNRLYIIYGKK
ncbi:MAG: hypothetical protein K2G88_05110 [Oscillospiraceae bacterium]|nr:hypothetical protein [Oscillospiraceae bacterium]